MPDYPKKRLDPRIDKTALGAAISSVIAGTAPPAAAQSELAIEEVIVTATKREASIQDIAASVQAIGQEDLEKGNVQGLEDFAKLVPSLSYMSGVGKSKIIFRGISDTFDTFIAEQSAAMYLDEQPLTQSNQANPRLVDIERIEALAGPQGTLYGSSSQSGTVRVVTNKPDLTGFEGVFDASLSSVDNGDSSYDISGVLNIPVVDDEFAVRLVGFTAEEGGFIDNVAGVDPYLGIVDNADVVQDNYNDTEITGGRISARWFINDDWTATASVILQDTHMNGSNEHDPTVGELQVVRFAVDQWDDEWSQFALTIEGDLGFAKIVSSSSYFERDTKYQFDNTTYVAYFGTFCYGAYVYTSTYCMQPAGLGPPGAYQNVTRGLSINDQTNTRFTQEIRLSRETDSYHWVAGVFYEKSDEKWDFFALNDNYPQSQAFYNWVTYYGINPPADSSGWWFSSDQTEWEQLAIFGELTMNFSDRFSGTLGVRWFDREIDRRYRVENPIGRPTNPDDFNFAPLPPGVDTVRRLPGAESDTVFKIAAQYDINDDTMIYALYSEGFRAGGTNRTRGTAQVLPPAYQADFLENFEIGIKSTLADGQVRLNATYFNMDWKDYQVELVDPANLQCNALNALPAPLCGQPWQKSVSNIGNANSTGVEVDLTAVVSDNFEFGLNALSVKAETEEEIVATVVVPKGQRLPNTPEFKGTIWGEFNWPTQWLGSENAYFRASYSHTGDSLNQLEPLEASSRNPLVIQDSYNVLDLKVGLQSDTWDASLFINNATDERGVILHNVQYAEWFFGRQRTAIIRPMEIGVRFIKRWN